MLRIAVLSVDGDEAAALARSLQAAAQGDGMPAPKWQADGRTALWAAALDSTVPADRLQHTARRHAIGYGLTLLCGLEAGAAGLFTHINHDLEAVHDRLRSALHGAAVSYQVLYGDWAQRLRHAQDAANTSAGHRPVASAIRQPGEMPDVDSRPARLRAWGCEKCSVPECEHLLFTRLVATR